MFRVVKTTAVAIAVFSMVSSGYADEGHGKQDVEGGAHKGMMMSGDKAQMPEMCRQMMQDRKALMGEMAEMEDALREKLATVKKAKGEARIEGLTEVVEALVARQRTMGASMMGGMSKMMGHMMAHMEKGGMMGGEGMMAMMADCPMMEGMMKGSGDSGADAGGHSEHH